MADNPARLTPKQKRFTKEYLKDLNGTQAAIRAGYSKHTANEQAARLLAKVSIQEEIKKGMDKQAEKLDLDVNYVLTKLKNIAEKCEDSNTQSAIKSLELLGKYLGMFNNAKLDVTVSHEDWLQKLRKEGQE